VSGHVDEMGTSHEARLLPIPPVDGLPSTLSWVATHLGELVAASGAPLTGSRRFRGGQRAAQSALDELDITGYAASRNEVAPEERRGATGLSPYVRHGFLALPTLWAAVADAPRADRDKFRDELLWQEYARHVYARLGSSTGTGMRYDLATWSDTARDPWREGVAQEMSCLVLAMRELSEDGWLPNQVRMWVASHWAVRDGVRWRDGEDALYRELVDGSRAANRLGWQWTVGTGTGRPYGFSRQQVERRAPGLCRSCALADACPIEDWPDDPPLRERSPDPLLRDDPDPARSAGPSEVETWREEHPAAVWVTAESLGDSDPALAAHPDLPVVFVLDIPLLLGLRLHPRRLVFLAESLADLALRRDVQVWRGEVTDVLDRALGVPLAATWTPVPGWRRRAARIPLAQVHPWPWLRRPRGGRIGSFSAWQNGPPLR
jgi:deoxyribodipyrimidine photo-lyase